VHAVHEGKMGRRSSPWLVRIGRGVGRNSAGDATADRGTGSRTGGSAPAVPVRSVRRPNGSSGLRRDPAEVEEPALVEPPRGSYWPRRSSIIDQTASVASRCGASLCRSIGGPSVQSWSGGACRYRVGRT
jgi:hypothetical protein